VARPLDARGKVEVRFFTDGVSGIAPPAAVKVVPAFQLADNVGITAFDVRAVPGDPRRHQAFVEVLNASAGSKQVVLKIAGAGASPLSRTLPLPGGARAAEVLDVSAFDGGPLRATVESATDALDLDNAAFAFLPMKRVVRVALITRGSPTLERSLALIPRVQLSVLPPERYGSSRGFDAVVFDRYAPKEQPGVPALLVRPPWVDWLPPAAGDTGESYVARWDAGHPLLRNLSLRDVTVDKASAVKLGPAAGEQGGFISAIASGPRDQPLILVSGAGARWAELTFALEESTFPLQSSFPVFLSNAVDWLTGEPPAMEHGLGLVRVPLASARVLDPDGKGAKAQAVPGGTLFEAGMPGIYTAVTSQQRMRVTVNMLDPGLTLVNQTQFAEVSRPLAAPPAPGLATDPWVLLLVAAIALLTIEWLTYNRRITI
jgi:hypothetical protein